MKERTCISSDLFEDVLENFIYSKFPKYRDTTVDLWILGDEAMQMLKIKSPTTLQKFRDEDRIRYSFTDSKNIIYYRPSIIKYIEERSNIKHG